jgi:dCMP deaminase
MKKAIVLYLPVWCAGYEKFLSLHDDAETILILGRSVTHQYRPFQKDLRALDPWEVFDFLNWKYPSKDIDVLELDDAASLGGLTHVVMPEEDISHEVAKMLPSDIEVTFDNSIFLRWDATSAKKHREVESATIIPADEFFIEADKRLAEEAEKSPDLWRQIAGMIFDEEKGVLMLRHNTIAPSFEELFFYGDPRGQFQKGVEVELSIADHVEAPMVAQAACRGIKLKGTSMFITTFPCPPCGHMLAHSGIKRLFFKEGYAMLDSEKVLTARGVELIRVEFPSNPES